MDRDLAKRIGTLREHLMSIEREILDQAPERDSLEYLKAAIDHVRISVWAMLKTGGATATGQTVVATFRLKHATNICGQIIHDLDTGVIQQDSTELLHNFAVMARSAATTADRIVAGM